MEFQVSTCYILHIGGSNKKMFSLMDSQLLKEISDERELGIIEANNLIVSQNCQTVYNKVTRIFRMFNRCITFKSKDILLALYKSLVLHLVEYYTPA
jgi:hypothetical protein